MHGRVEHMQDIRRVQGEEEVAVAVLRRKVQDEALASLSALEALPPVESLLSPPCYFWHGFLKCGFATALRFGPTLIVA